VIRKNTFAISLSIFAIAIVMLFEIGATTSGKEPVVLAPSTTIENSSPSVYISDAAPVPVENVLQTVIATEDTPPVTSPSPEPIKPPRYGFTDAEIYLLAQLLSGSKDKDGDGEYDIDFRKTVNYTEVYKVLDVVMNRVCSSKFPDTVTDVVMAKWQFSVMPANSHKTPSDRSLQVVQKWCEAYDSYDSSVQVVPASHLYFTGNGTINVTR